MQPWTLDPNLLHVSEQYPSGYELVLVNLVRERLESWQQQGYAGVTRTTLELLQWWTREGRDKRLFFAQLEAALTIIFLNEARPDFLQGIAVPREEPSDERKNDGYTGFQRYACKMATGAGKTTVMGMLAAWSILKQSKRAQRWALFRRNSRCLPQRDDPQPARRTRSAIGRRQYLPHPRPCAAAPDAAADTRQGAYYELARV